MPTPISRWEATASSIGFVGGLPAGTGAEADRGIAVLDPVSGFGTRYSLLCSLLNNAGATDLISVYTACAYYPTNPLYSVGGADTPMLWNPIFVGAGPAIYQIVLADSGASFLAGGTIAIEKDFDGGNIIFVTPAGNITVPMSAVPTITPGVGPWSDAPEDAGIWHSLYWGGIATSISVSESATWTNFYLSSNLAHVDGAAMTAADPGSWLPPVAIFDQPPASDAQHTLGYLSQFTYAPPPTVHDNGRFSEYRKWLNNATGLGVSMTAAREHGSLYAALVYQDDPLTLKFRKTYDSGASWVESPLFTDGVSPNSSPNLAWIGTRLHAVWVKLTSIVQSASADLGATWSPPVPLSISGTNPKFLVDHKHGIQYYFYLDGSANLLLVRSADYGATFIDASPLTVAAAIGVQTVAAEFASDGSLLVGYVLGGVWTQKRSADLGITWF